MRCLSLAAMLAVTAPCLAQTKVSLPTAQVVLKLSPAPGAPRGTRITPALQDGAMLVLRKRLTAFLFERPEVRALGADKIAVELPLPPGRTLPDVQQAVLRAIRPARLELIWLKDVQMSRSNESAPATSRYVTPDGRTFRERASGRTLSPKQVRERILYADPKNTILTPADLKHGTARVDTSEGGGLEIRLTFTQAGAKRLAAFTRTHIGSLVGIVLDGEILQAPVIRDTVTNGEVAITGNALSAEEARELVNLLNAGVLPATLRLESIRLVRDQ